MSRPHPAPAIRLRGVRQNNLKNFDLDLPLRQLTVITGLSGSGKSSLAFDTLFAEGQRRYIETFSPYARQFFDRMDKPKVDRIEGIPPAIAVEQRNSVRSTRSTVGTMTELCEYMKIVWCHLATLYCRGCGKPVRRDPPGQIWVQLNAESPAPTEVIVTFDLPLSAQLSLEESLALVERQGYQRLLLSGSVLRIEDALSSLKSRTPAQITVIQDRATLSPSSRARFVEACEQAYHFGKGRLTLWSSYTEAGQQKAKSPRPFSNQFHCADCELVYREPSPPLFSFNHPIGACPACKGFGRIISIDYRLAIPDPTKTLAGGLVKPWQSGVSADCQKDLLRACKAADIPTQIPFNQMKQAHQDWVVQGEPDYGKDEEHQWPHAWYGVKGYFRWLESKSYKMHVRVLLSRYRAYTRCETCQGQRFQPDSLRFQMEWPEGWTLPGELSPDRVSPATKKGTRQRRCTLSDFYQLPVEQALRWTEEWIRRCDRPQRDPLRVVLGEVRARLLYLNEVGLGYLTLDRPTRTLSGGETERVNLTTCLGTRLVNTLFVLDEPSVGLHPRDTEQLVKVLLRLRDTGNTVVVVEHEASVMRSADQILDLGPGQGERGGEIVFQGSYKDILKHTASLTGQYLSGRRRIDPPTPRPVDTAKRSSLKWLRARGVTAQNLQGIEIEIPLERLVCLTGVSGSGKTTLVREVLLPEISARLASADSAAAGDVENDAPDSGSQEDSEAEERTAWLDSLSGYEHLKKIVMVDQTALGRTPRSNPVVYIGAFEAIRKLFATTPLAKQRGLDAGGFSFNSAQGQCERCRGAGFEKIEMQFLSDVFVRCSDCNGRRYREHVLEIRLTPHTSGTEGTTRKRRMSATYPAPRTESLLLQETLIAPSRERGGPSQVTPQTSQVDSGWSIADMLEATVDDAITFLDSFVESRDAATAARKLRLLQEVGLGYLRLGQPINTLSGGESQRIKLVSHLAESAASTRKSPDAIEGTNTNLSPTLFIFDEPTTGLHFEDVRVLLKVFHRLVDAGHSLLIIEHNLDVIRSADWVIDLGPEAGLAGGRVVVTGTPSDVAACATSHTGAALRPLMLPANPTSSRSKKA